MAKMEREVGVGSGAESRTVRQISRTATPTSLLYLVSTTTLRLLVHQFQKSNLPVHFCHLPLAVRISAPRPPFPFSPSLLSAPLLLPQICQHPEIPGPSKMFGNVETLIAIAILIIIALAVAACYAKRRRVIGTCQNVTGDDNAQPHTGNWDIQEGGPVEWWGPETEPPSPIPYVIQDLHSRSGHLIGDGSNLPDDEWWESEDEETQDWCQKWQPSLIPDIIEDLHSRTRPLIRDSQADS